MKLSQWEYTDSIWFNKKEDCNFLKKMLGIMFQYLIKCENFYMKCILYNGPIIKQGYRFLIV